MAIIFTPSREIAVKIRPATPENPRILTGVPVRAFGMKRYHIPTWRQFPSHKYFRMIRVTEVASGGRFEPDHKFSILESFAFLVAEARQVVTAVSAEDQQPARAQDSPELVQPALLNCCRHVRKY